MHCTPLTPEERVIYTRRLADAEEQYHLLMTGQTAKVFVDQNGERIEYQQGSLTKLSAYIAELKSKLGLGQPLGPLNVWF